MRISPLVATLLGGVMIAAIASLGASIQRKLMARDGFTRDIANARQIVLALRLADAEERGLEVKTLDDLLTRGVIKDEALLYDRLSDGTRKARWLFFAENAKPDAPGGLPIIVSAEPKNGKRIIGASDTSVELWKGDLPTEWLRGEGGQKSAEGK